MEEKTYTGPIIIVDGPALQEMAKDRIDVNKLREFLLENQYAPKAYTLYFHCGAAQESKFIARVKEQWYIIIEPELSFVSLRISFEMGRILRDRRIKKITRLILATSNRGLGHWLINQAHQREIPVSIMANRDALAQVFSGLLNDEREDKVIVFEEAEEEILLNPKKENNRDSSYAESRAVYK